MSYQLRRGYGVIATAEGKFDAVKKMLEESGLFSEVDRYGDGSITNKTEVILPQDNYQDDELSSLYEQLTPCVVSAEIEFEGEDGQLWKHIFKGDGHWVECTGKVVYEEAFVFAD